MGGGGGVIGVLGHAEPPPPPGVVCRITKWLISWPKLVMYLDYKSLQGFYCIFNEFPEKYDFVVAMVQLSGCSKLLPDLPKATTTNKQCHAVPISLGDVTDCANSVGFQGLVPLLPDFCQVFRRWGYVGHIRKGYLEHPRSACCADDMFEIFVRFGRCICCLLPLFVNKQLPCPHTNSLHGLLLHRIHHKSLWCIKGLTLGVQSG